MKLENPGLMPRGILSRKLRAVVDKLLLNFPVLLICWNIKSELGNTNLAIIFESVWQNATELMFGCTRFLLSSTFQREWIIYEIFDYSRSNYQKGILEIKNATVCSRAPVMQK